MGIGFSFVNIVIEDDYGVLYLNLGFCHLSTLVKVICPGSHLAEERGGPDTFVASGPTDGADVCSSDLKCPQVEDCACHSMGETCDRFKPDIKQDRLFEKNFIRADPSYLKTLGQVHSGWIFGGIAELVDNSRDAKASK